MIGSRSGPHELVLTVSGSLGPDEIADLQRRVTLLLNRADPRPIVCDVSCVVDPDMSAIEALARVQLAARRAGREIQLRHRCAGLQELVDLAGLRETLPCETVEPG